MKTRRVGPTGQQQGHPLPQEECIVHTRPPPCREGVGETLPACLRPQLPTTLSAAVTHKAPTPPPNLGPATQAATQSSSSRLPAPLAGGLLSHEA